MTLRIMVIGAGAIGGYTGALLARAGHDVTFGVRGSTLAAISQNGITLLGLRGDWHVSNVQAMDAATFEGGKHAAFDLVLSCVKLYDAESSSCQWRAALESAGAVISLQNGIVHHLRRARRDG